MTSYLSPDLSPHWVYRIYDGDGNLLYVGMTSDPERRLRDWRRSSNAAGVVHWFSDARRMDWREYPNKRLTLTAELEAIKTERPRHNVKGAVAA